MTGSITHTHQTALPNDPTKDVSATAWNQAHTFTLAPSDVGLPDIADSAGKVTISGAASVGATGTPALLVTQTWNNAAGSGGGIELDITPTAFHNGAALLNLSVGGTSALLVDYNNNGTVEFQGQTGPMSFFSTVGKIIFGVAGASAWQINSNGLGLEAWTNANINTNTCTVATLPNPHGAGARNAVTDATLTHTAGIGTIVAGTGTNTVPVFYDGTNWRIG